MIFKIIPKYKLRHEGEIIQYKDSILLYNVKLNCYGNFSTENAIDIDRIESEITPNNKVPLYQSPEIRLLDPSLTQRYEAFLSNTQDTIWKIFY